MDYLQLFLFGLITSFGPCLFLCAPLIFPLIFTQPKYFSLFFLLFRLFAFVALSLLVFSFGNFLFRFLVPNRGLISIIAGLFLFFLGFWSFFGKGHFFYPKRFQWENRYFFSIILGILFGLLPCPPTLAVLTYLMLEGKTFLNAGYMGLAFALGEMILPLAILFFSQPLLYRIRNEKWLQISPFLSLILFFLIGFQLLLRGLPR
ncbi:MAG: sulfite exporter TauE/SafE family protein [candidate division WOR-3 bacterium]